MRGADRDPPQRRTDQHDRTRRLGTEPAHRAQLREAHSHGLDNAPAPRQRAESNGQVRREDDPEGHVEFRAQVAAGEEQDRDDPHGLLGIVGAVAEAVERSRRQLEPPEQPVHPAGPEAPEHPHRRHHEREPETEPDHRRKHDEKRDLQQTRRDQGAEPRLGHRRPRETADEGMRGAGGDGVVPGDEIPDDGARERPQDNPVVHDSGLHHAFPHRLRHVDPETEGRHEVEEGRPQHGLGGREHACGDNGGDGVGRIVKAIDVVERESDEDDEDDEEQRGGHGAGVTPS